MKETGTPIGIEIYPDGDGLKAKQVTDRYRSSATRNKLNDLQKVKAVEDLPPLKAKTTKAVYKYLKSKGKAQDVAKAFNMNPRPDITFKSSGDVVITPDECKPSYTIPGSVIDKFVESETTSKVVLHFDLEDGTHKALDFDSELDALNYLDSDDFPVGEWTGDYKIVPAKSEKSEYSVLSATEAKKLETLVKGISKGNEDSWYKWTQLASEIGVKHLGNSLARYGSGRFEAFCEIIDNLETFQYYKTINLDKMLARRLPDKESEECSKKKKINESLTKDQKDLIIDIIKADFECGMVDIEAFAAYVEDEDDFVGCCYDAVDFYEELANLGPAGMLEEYSDLDWDEDFVAEYGDNESEYVDLTDHSNYGATDKSADWFKKSEFENLKATIAYLDDHPDIAAETPWYAEEKVNLKNLIAKYGINGEKAPWNK